MTTAHPTNPRVRLAKLTPTEERVLRELVRDGAGNRVIARRLGVIEDTVKSHMKSVLRKTGSGCRTSLAVDILRRRVVVTVVFHGEQVPA